MSASQQKRNRELAKENTRLTAELERSHKDWEGAAKRVHDAIEERNKLKDELEEGDYWMKRVSDALANGTCPVCFATDEAGHTDDCPGGKDERELEKAREENENLHIEVIKWRVAAKTGLMKEAANGKDAMDK